MNKKKREKMLVEWIMMVRAHFYIFDGAFLMFRLVWFFRGQSSIFFLFFKNKKDLYCSISSPEND